MTEELNSVTAPDEAEPVEWVVTAWTDARGKWFPGLEPGSLIERAYWRAFYLGVFVGLGNQHLAK